MVWVFKHSEASRSYIVYKAGWDRLTLSCTVGVGGSGSPRPPISRRQLCPTAILNFPRSVGSLSPLISLTVVHKRNNVENHLNLIVHPKMYLKGYFLTCPQNVRTFFIAFTKQNDTAT